MRREIAVWVNYASRHCEERSDEAIHSFRCSMDCFAPLAMTGFNEPVFGCWKWL
jgi:hypothetical protein